jgi:hypothetical protein
VSGTEIILIAAAVGWLGLLTFTLLLCVRQVAVLTVRVERTVGFSVADDGLPIGFPIPEEVADVLPAVRRRLMVLFMSATCAPCRELARELGTVGLGVELAVLVSGAEDVATAVAGFLPSDVLVLRDPDATRVARALQVRSTPFATLASEGSVFGKTYANDVSDLESLVNALPTTEDKLLRTSEMEVVPDVG